MFEVLSDNRVGMPAVIKASKDPLLFLAPGRLALAKLEQVLAGQFDAPFRLKDALVPVLSMWRTTNTEAGRAGSRFATAARISLNTCRDIHRHSTP